MVKTDQVKGLRLTILIIALIVFSARMIQNIVWLEEASNLITELEQSKGYALNPYNVPINSNEIADFYSDQADKRPRLYFLGLYAWVPISFLLILAAYCSFQLRRKKVLRWIPISTTVILCGIVLAYSNTLVLVGHALE